MSDWQHSRLGALLWAPDFFTGVSAGLLAGLVAVGSESLATEYQAVLLAVAGIAAAFGALVLAVLPVLLSTLSGPYRALLRETRGGVPGVVVPFRQSVLISLMASGVAIVVAIAWPLQSGSSSANWQRALWGIAAGVPVALWIWALGATFMLVTQLERHMRNQEQADQLAAQAAEAREQLAARGVPIPPASRRHIE